MESNYFKFQLALERLQEKYEDHIKADNRPELNESDRESIKESCIQRFETCFDTLWKHLRKYLEEHIGLADLPNGPKPLFRLAVENEVIDSFEKWANYNNKRIGTSHDYSGKKADDAMKIVPSFIDDAIRLFENMTSTKWKQ